MIIVRDGINTLVEKLIVTKRFQNNGWIITIFLCIPVCSEKCAEHAGYSVSSQLVLKIQNC